MVQLHSFLTSALDGGGWSTSRHDPFSSQEEPWHPLDRKRGGPQTKWGGPQTKSGGSRNEKTLLALPS